MSASPADTVNRFLGAINAHDLELLASLLSDSHRLTDSLGNTIVGRENVEAAWRRYFEMVPDYLIRVERQLAGESEVALFGRATGSVAVSVGPPREWSLPVAVRTRVESGRVVEWQVFADNEPVRAILRRRPAV